MPGAVTDHLTLLLAQLHTNQALRADFVSDPANAIAAFDLTAHERHAVLKRDCDDFVVLDAVDSTGDLPDLFDCPSGGGGHGIADLLDAIREWLEGLFKRRPLKPDLGDPVPHPPEPDPDPGPFPPPGPLPRPRPGPRPGPTPGPDPPGPDIRGPRRGGGGPSPPRG